MAANDLEHSVTDDIRQRLFAPSDRHASDFGRRKEARVVLPALPTWSERVGLPAFFTARTHAQGALAASGTKPRVLSLKNFSAMRGDVAYALKLMMQEKEILVFALLQWLVIPRSVLYYYYYYPCALVLSLALVAVLARWERKTVLGVRLDFIPVIAAIAIFVFSYPQMAGLGSPWDSALGYWR